MCSVCFSSFTQGWWVRVDWIQRSSNILWAPVMCSACQGHVGDTRYMWKYRLCCSVSLQFTSHPLCALLALSLIIISTLQCQHFPLSHRTGNGGDSGNSGWNVVWMEACSVWIIRPTFCPLCVSAFHSLSSRGTQVVDRICMHINKRYNTKGYNMVPNSGAQTIWRLWELMVGGLEYSWKMRSDLGLKSK